MRLTVVILLTVIPCLTAEVVETENVSSEPNPFQIVWVGVPESASDIDPNPPKEGFTRRSIRAIYRWDGQLKERCNYKVKAEAITTVRVTKGKNPTEKSRYFVKIYVDHKLVDVVEHEESVKFSDDLIKNGWFIHKTMIESCERFTFEYLMKGGGCRARLYEKQNVFELKKGVFGKKKKDARNIMNWIVKEDEDAHNIAFVQDWQWKATDEDECEDSNFAEEYAKQHPPPTSVTV